MSEHHPETNGKRTLSRGQRKAGNKEQEQRAGRTSGGSKPEDKEASRSVTERAAILGNVRR
jgi:hypothetical protein